MAWLQGPAGSPAGPNKPLPPRRPSSRPGMRLKRGLERRLGDAAGVVRDRRRGDRGNHLEKMILAEAGGEEAIDVSIVEAAALLDHGFRQSRQRGVFAVLGQTPF